MKSYSQMKLEARERFIRTEGLDIAESEEQLCAFNKGFEVGWMLSWKYEEAKKKELMNR